jgi:hypothetical protein
VLPISEQTEATGIPQERDELVTGDLGLVVIRALLENGVGYVVSSWQERPTPIDAAIDEARDRVLSPRGVVLRRLRSLGALAPIIAKPSGGITGEPPRGAVVFAGRRGLRPALEQFCAIATAGAVVGLCFDDDALRIEGAIVIDPEPTARGIVAAIDAAFEASLLTGRPSLVLVRERALGMRGTIRRRPERSPVETAAQDAAHRTEHETIDAASAAERVGLTTAALGSAGAGPAPVLLVAGPMRRAVERALGQVAAELAGRGAAAEALADELAIVHLGAPGVLPSADGAIDALLAGAPRVDVVGARAERIVEQLRTRIRATLRGTNVDPGVVRGERLEAIIARSILDRVHDLDDDVRATLEQLASSSAGTIARRTSRVPRRSDVLHRAVSPSVAAGLALAQGVVGVPGRIDANFPTFRTDTGVPLTFVPAELFATHGIATAAPGSGAGVFVVTGGTSGIAEAATAAGASIEYVDGSSPRAIGVAIATACRTTRVTSQVILVTDVQRVAAPRTSVFGMDPELVGTERLATAAVPTAATALVELGEELLAGPSVIALDHPSAHAALDPLRELSPATWDLARLAPTTTRSRRLAWNLRRRLVRTVAGVDL